jgi:hypothetical protein
MGKTIESTFSKPVPPPRDYFVPNFGVDHDIAMTSLNLGEAEDQHGHKYELKAAPAKNP